MSDNFRVIVGVPSGDTWNARFGVDLVNLVANFTKKQVSGYRSQSLQVVNVRSSILSKNRLDLVKAARQLHATHLFFVDSDQTFPPDVIHRLAAHHELIVAANIATKTLPACPTARGFDPLDPKGKVIYTDPESTGKQLVWRIGTGVMLINMKVFDRLSGDLWGMKYLPEADTYQGEDWTFCEKCVEAGISLYIDHDVSKLIGHVGDLEFTHDFVGTLSRETGSV